MWCVCCRKKAKEDPFDDGQNVYGVNYKEYLAWKNGEDIGDRKLPKKYQNLSFHNAARKAKKINEDVNETVDDVKDAVNTKTAKWKEKAMGMQIKMGQKKDGQAGDGQEETEDKELIVGDAMAGQAGTTHGTQDTVELVVQDDGAPETPIPPNERLASTHL